MQPHDSGGGKAIVIDGLTKRFGELVALDDVSFEVAEGSVFGLLGPNGAGKTTAVRILATLLRPDAGRASVLGLDVVHDAAALRRRIGLAGQYAAVDANLTGRENLRLIGRLSQLPRAEFRRRADELLDSFDLTPAGNRTVREYSGGMRRRLDVAAALVARPDVLFLDEPTTGLDISSRNGLWSLIRELVSTGTTVVLTTQYLEEADRLADRIAIIDNGRVIANDTPSALKAALGATVIDVELTDEAAAIRTAEAFASLAGTRTDRHETSITVSSSDGSRLLIEAVRILDGLGVTPQTLQVRAPTLDDAFLRLTGHGAESTAAAQTGSAA